MLDYSLDKDTAKNFILFFEEDGDNIKVNLASGEDYPVPNTEENKKHLLEVMEQQVDNAWRFESKQQKEKKSAKNWLIYDGAFLLFNAIMMIVNPSLLTGIAIGCFVIAGTGNLLRYKNCNKNLKDLEKHEVFLRNNKRINEYLNRGNEEIKDKTLNPVKKEETNTILNINDIHNMSYENVTRILSDIDRDEKFGIARPKVLSKKYLPNSTKE